MSTELLTKKSGHLAWCAMVALQLAKHDGQVNSESQENLFLAQWERSCDLTTFDFDP